MLNTSRLDISFNIENAEVMWLHLQLPCLAFQALDKVSSPFRTSLSERLLPEYDDYAARRRAKYIVRSILECKKAQGYPAEMFLEKPSKKEYKDYYSIIPNPIDLKIIVNKVIGDKVGCTAPLHNMTTKQADSMALGRTDVKMLCPSGAYFGPSQCKRPPLDKTYKLPLVQSAQVPHSSS